MAGRLVRALTAGLVLLCVATPGSALPSAGQDGFAPCSSLSGVLCRTVSVPLDYENGTPGRVRLFVTKREPTGASKGTILLLAGGPGEPSAQTFTLTSKLWRSLFPGYTVAAYDNRGTGASQALRCSPAATAGGCARKLGPRRVFYGTRENAEDVEAVRRALGVDRIALFGISYGTRQALAYARRYPEHVERLLLDSVVPGLDGADPFDLASLEAISSALGSICNRGACAGITGSPGSDFAKLANMLDEHPLVARAKVYVDQWTPRFRAIRLDGLGLLALARASDLNAGVAISLPAATRAALSGRTAPLERMAALIAGEPPADVNHGVFLATTCNDGPFPWHPAPPSPGVEPSSRTRSPRCRPARSGASGAGRRCHLRSRVSTGPAPPGSPSRTPAPSRTCRCWCWRAIATCARRSAPGRRSPTASSRAVSSSCRASDTPSWPRRGARTERSAAGWREESHRLVVPGSR